MNTLFSQHAASLRAGAGVKSIPQRVTGRDEEPLTVEKVKGGLKRTERKKRKSQVTEALPAISIYFIKTMLSC